MSAIAMALPRGLLGVRGHALEWAHADSADASTEQRLMLAARQGDPSAFEALVVRFQTPIYNFCLRMLGQTEDAADVAQETFVQLYQHLHQLDVDESVAPWLYRVARNRCLDVLRRRRTVPLEPPDEAGGAELPDRQPLPDELAERADLQQLLLRAIATLPPAYAEVVSLRYAADRSFAEIACILNCDEGAARVRFHRAKGLLREALHAISVEHA